MKIKFDQDFRINEFNEAQKRFRGAKNLYESKLAYADAELAISNVEPSRLSPKQYKIYLDMKEETEAMRRVINGQPKQKCRRKQCDRFQNSLASKERLMELLQRVKGGYDRVERRWVIIQNELKDQHGITLTEEVDGFLSISYSLIQNALSLLESELETLPPVIYGDTRDWESKARK